MCGWPQNSISLRTTVAYIAARVFRLPIGWQNKGNRNRLVRFTPDLHLENEPNVLVKYKREAGKSSEAKGLAMTYWMAKK